MADFTSALYLGLNHESSTLRHWQTFTVGKPAVLHTLPGSRALAAELASLAGCEAATLAPSTLHVFQDLFFLWPPRSTTLYMDAGLYETARWGIQRVQACGAEVHRFCHYDAGSLARLVRREPKGRNIRIIATDGYCPGCGRAAPLPAFLDCLPQDAGWLVVDDTQALGVLGRAPIRQFPLGRGGGGIVRWLGIHDPRILLVSSLAKGFGVPLAVLAGAEPVVDRFESTSQTRVHCSPVSSPALHAAEQALAFNEHGGDRARAALARLVLLLRRKLGSAGIPLRGGLFPVQSVAGTTAMPAEETHRRLAKADMQTVLQRDRCSGEARVGILLSARHSPREVTRLAGKLIELLGRPEKNEMPINHRERSSKNVIRTGV